MAIIIDTQVYRGISMVTHPDKTKKLTEVERKIVEDIFTGIHNARDKATQIADANNEKYSGKYKYPFEYTPEKDEYCFLISKGYPDNEVINSDLQEIYKNKCAELQKHNFSFEDQILVTKHLKDISEEKREDVLKAHEILNNPKGHSNSELNDSLDCVMGISDEC